jgi:hypothetical protein
MENECTKYIKKLEFYLNLKFVTVTDRKKYTLFSNIVEKFIGFSHGISPKKHRINRCSMLLVVPPVANFVGVALPG